MCAVLCAPAAGSSRHRAGLLRSAHTLLAYLRSAASAERKAQNAKRMHLARGRAGALAHWCDSSSLVRDRLVRSGRGGGTVGLGRLDAGAGVRAWRRLVVRVPEGQPRNGGATHRLFTCEQMERGLQTEPLGNSRAVGLE